ncbi:acetolactate synthase [Paludisphaera mucosa]|uniref:Acetolactate synthase n=1 Tax=Paludisphaera mucosa TaxID=3030827 RepID=A0ABT6FFB6_9BACT|nr:acetolactate synthase [Paludisphaera mucosa]MDG3006267.1 acetolactate synthase [Paludisphaera mucosa]
MSLGEDGGSEVEVETIHGRNWPSVTQFSVFLENRVGQLLEVVRSFQGSKVKIVGLTISDSADCSILRLILSHPEQGREILSLNKHAFAENELVAAELPASASSLADMCLALLRAEINIHYAYPLIVQPHGRPSVAMHIDNNEQASRSLHDMGFEILCEADLSN